MLTCRRLSLVFVHMGAEVATLTRIPGSTDQIDFACSDIL